MGWNIKGLCRWIVGILFLVSVCQTGMAADFSHLVILHTNDTHGFDQQADGVYGMAAVAALKKEYETNGYDVLLVDGGDAIQDNNLVNFSKGASAITFMNAAGYDAMTLGNHEFDYGQDVTLQRVKEARFPVVSCNIIVDATGQPFVQPRAILHKGPVCIGIVGMTTPATVTSTNPKNVYGLQFLAGSALYAKVQQEVADLQRSGCDVIIALGHLGSETGSMGNRSDDVLQHVQGIDIFIDGHDHQVKNERIGKALLVETGYHTENIGRISYKQGQWQENIVPYGTYKKQDSAVKQVVDQSAAEVAAELGKSVGTSDVSLDGSRVPGVRTQETNLGDCIADAVLWQSRMATAAQGTIVDGAIVNGGGLRASLEKGPVTVGTVHNILPYNNQIYTMKIKGSKLLEIMEAALAAAPGPAGAFPQVAGMKMTVHTNVPYKEGRQYDHSTYHAPAVPGSRVTIEEVNGKAFDPEAVYTIATFEFLCRGGDTYGALAEPGAADIQGIGYIDTEAVINYKQDALKGNIGNQYAASAGRITLLK